MKILQINKFFYRRRGAETYFFDLIDLQQSKGHDVGVFAMQHPDNIPHIHSKHFASHVEFGDINALPLSSKFKSAVRIIWNVEAKQKLEQLLDEFTPDIAHIHNIYHQLSPSILPVLKKRGIPIIQTLHDYKLLAPNYNLLANGEIDESSKGGKYYNAVLNKAVKNSYAASTLAATEMYIHKYLQVYEKNVDCFISPSEFLREKVREWGINVKRIEVLPNFIDVHAIQPHYTNNANNNGYLLYAGALYKEKGVDILLDSLVKIKYGIPLRIAGSGPELTRLQHMVQKNMAKETGGEHAVQSPVQFLGNLSKSQLAEQIANALAVVVPSRWYENYPYSTLEAFAYGKPVIAANIGGLPEQVRPGETGWLFQPGDSDSLAATIVEAARDAVQVNKLGRQARHWVEKELNPQQHYTKLHAIYQEYTSS